MSIVPSDILHSSLDAAIDEHKGPRDESVPQMYAYYWPIAEYHKSYMNGYHRVHSREHQPIFHIRMTPISPQHYKETSVRLQTWFRCLVDYHALVLIGCEVGSVTEKPHFHCVFYSLIVDDDLKSYMQRFKRMFREYKGNEMYSSCVVDEKFYGYSMKDKEYMLVGYDWTVCEEEDEQGETYEEKFNRVYAEHLESKKQWNKNWKKQGILEAIKQDITQRGIKRPSTKDYARAAAEYYVKRGKVCNPAYARYAGNTARMIDDPEYLEYEIEKWSQLMDMM